MTREEAVAKVLELHQLGVSREDVVGLVATMDINEDHRVDILQFIDTLHIASPPPSKDDYAYSRHDGGAGSERDKGVTKSVTEEESESDGVTRERIEEWVRDTTGWFSYDDLDRDLAIRDPKGKANRRQILKRLKDEGVVESHPQNNKLMRFVNVTIRKIDFKRVVRHTSLDIRFPFGEERLVRVYPGNIIVNAGAPDAGKTAYLLNFVRLNQHRFPIFYQCSEMDADELAGRLANFENIGIEDWTFEAEKRATNFADVIRPDSINIVDYLEMTTELYLVADHLRAIHDKLASGIALVAIQKKKGEDYGRGAEFSLEKPRLYLSMDHGYTRIMKAKNWVTPDVNPRSLRIEYKIVAGCRFIITHDWYDPDDPQRDVTPRHEEVLAGADLDF